MDKKIPDFLFFPELPMYPVIERSVDDTTGLISREQITVAPNRNMLILLHPASRHYCGYVPIKKEDWARISESVKTIANVRVDYEGEANAYIVWMQSNGAGRLTLRDHEVGMYWVGFSSIRDELSLSIESVREMLHGFENMIWRLRNGDIVVGG